MKKTILAVLLTLLSCFVLSLCCINTIVLAEGEQNATENTENIVSNELSDETAIITDTDTESAVESIKSEVEIWVENNLGWLVGIPIGTLISFLLEILALAKKAKETASSLKETKDINETVKKEIAIAKNMLVMCDEMYDKVVNSVEAIKSGITENSSLVQNATETFKSLINTDNLLNEKISKLEKEFGVLVTQNKDYVVSGKAEEVNDIIRG